MSRSWEDEDFCLDTLDFSLFGTHRRRWEVKPLLRESRIEIRDTEAITRKQHFIVLAQTQWTRVQRLSLENKGVSSYIPLQAGYRSKKQGLTHI